MLEMVIPSDSSKLDGMMNGQSSDICGFRRFEILECVGWFCAERLLIKPKLH